MRSDRDRLIELINEIRPILSSTNAESLADHLLANGVIVPPKSIEDYDRLIEDIQTEAVTEFAEKAIDKVEKARQKYQRLCKEQMDEAMNIHFNGMINLLKELVGEGGCDTCHNRACDGCEIYEGAMGEDK